MPLFKFKKSGKKSQLKSSSMGNLYKDYGGNLNEECRDSKWEQSQSTHTVNGKLIYHLRS